MGRLSVGRRGPAPFPCPPGDRIVLEVVSLASILLVLSFFLLAKGASWLVDGAIGIAERFRVPKFLIGVVLLGFATTAPEFAVSIISAITGNPEMALGNAVGSVIVDDGVALALVGILAASPVIISRKLLRTTAAFLILIDVTAFVLILTNRTDGKFVLTRTGGAVLLGLFFVYIAWVVWDRMRRPGKRDEPEETSLDLMETEEKATGMDPSKLAALFVFGLALVVGASHVVVISAKCLAEAASVPPAVAALTVVAIGTSIPEIATCIAAARKGHGALAVGDIVGADILNIAWIAGASAVVNPLEVDTKVIYFMFPSMLAIVFVTLGGLLWKGRMTKGLGGTLIGMYVVYMGLMVYLFPPGVG